MAVQPSAGLSIAVHGVVSRHELLAAGIERGAIEHQLRTGRLFRKYRGVYAVGRPDLTVWGERRAIVLACGRHAVLSHRSAAAAWGIRPEGGARWHVTVPSDRRPDGPVRLYRCRLAADETTTHDGIPITTVPRTLLDLSSLIPVHQLRRVVMRADELELFDRTAVVTLLERHRGRPGTPVLAALLEDFRANGETYARSDVESLFLELCLDHHLPRPTINRYNNGREIDATWPGHNLLVEVDSWKHHRSRVAFGRDRAKDRRALISGCPTALHR